MDCIFCNIVRGFVPATVRGSDDEFLAFDDIYPKAPTHVLIIPRDHCADLDTWVAGGGSGDRMLAFVGTVARDLNVTGAYRLLTNVGSDAGQLIFHQHWHLMSGQLRPM
ncbi:MAG: Hit family protein [Thermoleophilia bacterium]|nr:Hit family protein [Thermoleophilia bacterium]